MSKRGFYECLTFLVIIIIFLLSLTRCDVEAMDDFAGQGKSHGYYNADEPIEVMPFDSIYRHDPSIVFSRPRGQGVAPDSGEMPNKPSVTIKEKPETRPVDDNQMVKPDCKPKPPHIPLIPMPKPKPEVKPKPDYKPKPKPDFDNDCKKKETHYKYKKDKNDHENICGFKDIGHKKFKNDHDKKTDHHKLSCGNNHHDKDKKDRGFGKKDGKGHGPNGRGIGSGNAPGNHGNQGIGNRGHGPNGHGHGRGGEGKR